MQTLRHQSRYDSSSRIRKMGHIVEITAVFGHLPRKIDQRQPLLPPTHPPPLFSPPRPRHTSFPFIPSPVGYSSRSTPVTGSRPTPNRFGCVINTGTIPHARQGSASAVSHVQ